MILYDHRLENYICLSPYFILLQALTHVLEGQVIADYFQCALAIRFTHSEGCDDRVIIMAGVLLVGYKPGHWAHFTDDGITSSVEERSIELVWNWSLGIITN